MTQQVLTLTYNGATFEVTNQAAYESAITAFCRYHSMREDDLTECNYRYILGHVYPHYANLKTLTYRTKERAYRQWMING